MPELHERIENWVAWQTDIHSPVPAQGKSKTNFAQSTPIATPLIESHDDARLMDAVLAWLKAQDRLLYDCLTMAQLQDRSSREVAKILRINTRTLSARKSTALAMVQVRLNQVNGE